MNRNQRYTDKEIIDGLLAGGPPMEKYSLVLYRSCKGYVHKVGQRYPTLSDEELQDAYIDAVDSTIRIILKKEYKEGKGKLSTLLYQIFSNKCVDQLRMQTNHKSEWQRRLERITSDLPNTAKDFLTTLMSKSDFDNIVEVMEHMNDTCKDLILDFDYWGFKPGEVAKKRGYKSGKSASQAKYGCMEELRKLILRENVAKNADDDPGR